MMPDALLCTVGTSMFTKIPEFREGSVDLAATRLDSLLDPAGGGAEHENISLLCRSGLVEPKRLYLFCSDTDEGEKAARILESRFQREFRVIEIVRCRDLRDNDPKAFCTRGLRSLVNNLVRTITRLKEKEGFSPAIDATGGYKPQIAYAALVGQVMQVPVFYRYLGFPEVLTLQPLPVTVDPGVWFDHLHFFERLRTDLLSDREIPQGDSRITPLLEREDRQVMLSPLGELMAAAADRLLGSTAVDLLPPASGIDPDKKKILYEDQNSGRHPGLADFCNRLRAAPYVTKIGTFYFNPDLPKRGAVRLPPDKWTEPDRLEVWYGDGRALTKLNVWTTARTNRELAAARLDLARRLDFER